MIFRLPKDKKALTKDITEKISKLNAVQQKEWYVKFDDCVPDKDLYENLLQDIQKGNIQPTTIQDKKYLEERITAKENELLQLLNVSINATDLDKALAKANALSGQGNIAIRPPIGKSLPQKREKKKK